jgi:hypothetical protein
MMKHHSGRKYPQGSFIQKDNRAKLNALLMFLLTETQKIIGWDLANTT